ncbi:MAG: alpha/beta hydrolase [Caulobacteraceae bacterium]|nr:alpha/beta hydrolase [Caulobacteraceae bacterium]
MADHNGIGALTRRTAFLAGLAALTPAAATARAPLVSPSGLAPLSEGWKRAQSLPLWDGAPPDRGFKAQPLPPDYPQGFIRNVTRPELRVFRPSQPNGRALLVMPGGAYTFVVATHEGAGVAEEMARSGYTVFVLVYRLPGEGWASRWDVPLQDAQRAVRLIKARAQTFGYSPQSVAVLGFSAGGHLAASLITAASEKVYVARDEVDHQDANPAAAGLIYPVITLTPPYTHPGSATALLGSNPDPAIVERRSPQRRVSASTPPTFLVHALDDPAVPYQNSALMLEALKAAKVPAEAHFFEEGGHAFGLGAPGAPASLWPALFRLWLDRRLSET